MDTISPRTKPRREATTDRLVSPVPASPPGGSCDDARLRSIYVGACTYFESNGLNHMDAQDLAIKVWLRWLTQMDQGRGAGLAWLRLVERNLLIDHCRRHRREQRLLESYAKDIRDHTPPEVSLPNGHFEDVIRDLSPKERRLLFAHYVEGRKIKELAEEMKLSGDCLKKRLHRAREKLRLQLVNGVAHCNGVTH